jgi:tRNA 2-selenouridine synthase
LIVSPNNRCVFFLSGNYKKFPGNKDAGGTVQQLAFSGKQRQNWSIRQMKGWITLSDNITAAETLDLFASASYDMLDVRSEGEFAAASIPGFQNTPILRNTERHEVGLCYRQQGQTAAIELGVKLVGPVRDSRIQGWLQKTRPAVPLVVACWRGGLRSQIATEWLAESGRSVRRVAGGYKALRQELLNEFTRPQEFLVLSGLTGSGKTRLLETLPLREKLNIEAMAVHRGSSFGKFLNQTQPTQATFENRLALALRGCQRPVLVEDESKVIGSLHLPETLFQTMSTSPVILLESSLTERAQNIYQEYLVEALQNDVDSKTLEASAIASTLKLQRRLGGLLTSHVVSGIQAAFASRDPEAHIRWIEMLLNEYYDNRYRYSQIHASRPLAFRGTYEECQQWILNQYA